MERVAADIHSVPKWSRGLRVMYTPHKSSPCTCRAVEAIAEISRKGTARPLSIEPVRGEVVVVGEEKEDEKTGVVVAEELERIISFLGERVGRKVPLELDSEYTRSKESLKLLISQRWEFTTRIRSDAKIGRRLRERMLRSSSPDAPAEGMIRGESASRELEEEYGGPFRLIGRVIVTTRDGKKHFILYLSTMKGISARRVIEKRSSRWRIENLFKNVDIDCTPGGNEVEIKGYYTLAFFMSELTIAFKSSTKTIGLLMNRDGTISVEDGVMMIRLRNLDSRLLMKVDAYARHINSLYAKKAVKFNYRLMDG